MIQVGLFIAGAITGSFLNVCIYRLPRGGSVVRPRSFCPSCGKSLAWYDNIPVFSYVLLRGRCRFCNTSIPLRYLLVEIIAGAVCIACFAGFGFTIRAATLWILLNALIVVSFIDLRFLEIPDVVTLPGIVLGMIIAALFPASVGSAGHLQGFLNSLLGVVAGGGSIYILGFVGEFIFKKEAMGGGDVKLLAMIGSFIGWKLALFTFFLAPFFGSIIGIALKLKEGRKTIPYGPYLSLAALVAIFYGEEILGRLFMF